MEPPSHTGSLPPLMHMGYAVSRSLQLKTTTFCVALLRNFVQLSGIGCYMNLHLWEFSFQALVSSEPAAAGGDVQLRSTQGWLVVNVDKWRRDFHSHHSSVCANSTQELGACMWRWCPIVIKCKKESTQSHLSVQCWPTNKGSVMYIPFLMTMFCHLEAWPYLLSRSELAKLKCRGS